MKLSRAKLIFLNGVFERAKSTLADFISIDANGFIHFDGKQGAREVVEMHFSGDAFKTVSTKVKIETHLEEGAKLELTITELYDGEAEHSLSHTAYLKKDSRLEILSVTRGAKILNDKHEVYLEGEGAWASLKGLSLLTGESHADHNLAVHHTAPGGTSRQFYKNILTERSQSRFDSLVHVTPGAVRSDSNQLNRNLLLSDEARAIASPELKIDADDVACTHGATVGQIDKNELFYLETRGISKMDARFLMTYGFAEEILESVAYQSLRASLETLVNHELKKACLYLAGD